MTIEQVLRAIKQYAGINLKDTLEKIESEYEIKDLRNPQEDDLVLTWYGGVATAGMSYTEDKVRFILEKKIDHTLTFTFKVGDVYNLNTVTIPKGYKVIDFRPARPSDTWLPTCNKLESGYADTPVLILEKI